MENHSFKLLLYLFWEAFPTLFHRFSNKYKTASYLFFVVALLLLQVPFATTEVKLSETDLKPGGMHSLTEYTCI
jgi:hypothetical protein